MALLPCFSISEIAMIIERGIQRHQLTFFLNVFNRFTDKSIGYLGGVSEGGLMLFSHLPVLVDANFDLRLKLPGETVDLKARSLWCHEDATPNHYDSGFVLYEPPGEYRLLIRSLRQYFSFQPFQASA